jgi:hypothetical protein
MEIPKQTRNISSSQPQYRLNKNLPQHYLVVTVHSSIKMKTFAAISTLLFAAASAAPTEKRQAAEYDITNFSANTTPHGTGA